MNPLFDYGAAMGLMGLRVEVAEPGTTITDERTGQKETMPPSGALMAGNVMYCTKDVYDKLAAEFAPLVSPVNARG